MDDKFFYFFVLLIVAYGLRLLFIKMQVKNMLNSVMENRKKGYVHIGIGQGSHRGLKELVMICTDKSYYIVHAERMSGFTIFSKYQPYAEVVGKNAMSIVSEGVIPEVTSKRTAQAIIMACEQITKKERSI